MKKLFVSLFVGALLSNVYAQFICGTTDSLDEPSRSDCSRYLPLNAEDTMLHMHRFIPDGVTPEKRIPVNINVWRNDDGTGNWWQDSQAFRDSMQVVIGYLNYIYWDNVPFSDTISDAVFIPDTKIRFEIDTFYYYNNTTIAHKVYPGDFNDYLSQNHPERLKRFNIHLSIGNSGNISGWSSGIGSEYQCFVCLSQYQHPSLWALATTMAHEFGHNCGLKHPYDSEYSNISHYEFLWDLFGHVQQPWCTLSDPLLVCYHDAGWDCDPYNPSTTCTNNIMGGTYLSRHFTALQCGRIHRALSVAPIRKYAYGYSSTPYVVSSSQTWDFTRKMYQDIVIDSLATLTITCTLEMVDSARLIVRPGGKLIVNGGTLTSACDGEMWQGIIVEGNPSLPQYAQRQGSVILNNATVENARNAISTRGADTNAVYEHTGGIVQATNTLFRNNRRAAEFLEYENHSGSNVTDNTSRFTRCTFIVDDDNLFASNGTSFLEHVSMWRVRGVKFNGCDFRNETTGTSVRGTGIRSIEAGFTAKRVCPQLSNSDPCGCYNSGSDTVRRCSFTGFSEAVHAANTLGAYDITLDNCDFAYNSAGVSLYAADNARVSFCDFALGDSLSVLGLLLSRCSGFTVEGNSFHKHSLSYPYPTGILCDSTGTAENIIRLNSFTGLYTACNAVGNNGAIPKVTPSGLQYQCNSFSGNTYDILVSPSSRIRPYQGSSSQGADNTFTGTLTSSLSLSSGSLRYYYSTGSGHAPIGATSNVTVLDATANACGSTLCGVQGGGGGSGLGPKGTPALAQYREMAEEYAAIVETCHGASPQTDATDPQYETDNAALSARLSDLSAAMGDLARTEIRNILCDSVPDMELLKEWYGVVIAAAPATGDIPVSAYQLAEVYSQEGGQSTAAALLAALPQQFIPDEAACSEYSNYMALQQLRETVAGNWYLMTDTDIEAMQRVAEHDNGRAARMAKEILCFFHHICYGDDMVLNLGDIGERNLRGGRTRCVPTDNGLVIYPNPTGGTLTVESASPIREITVYDLSGRVMMTANGGIVETCHGASLQMDVSSLQGGIYLLRVVTTSGVETGRFVKN